MSRSLLRILRLRSLLEEESRIKLDKLAQHATRIYEASAEEQDIVSVCRDTAFSAITEATGRITESMASPETALPPAKEAWLIASTGREVAQWRKGQLEALAQKAASRVEACREEMISRRKERLQVETLLCNEAMLRKSEFERHQQKVLDDWFAATRHRGRR